MTVELHLGDGLEVMATLPPSSIDSIVTDPPYGLSFMNKNWDHGVPGVPFWEAALRVAKPGAMLLAFGGTRTHHRLMVAIEDAGWEIRDCLMWLYGSGFPKSHDISKAIDKAAGAEREGAIPGGHMGYSVNGGDRSNGNELGTLVPHVIGKGNHTRGTPATDAAKQWDGWGTALKPAWEPIILAMKPLDGTFANNALVHGVAGLNVDACRIEGDKPLRVHNGNGSGGMYEGRDSGFAQGTTTQGRWPANVLLDEAAAAMLDEQTGERKSGSLEPHHNINGPTTLHAYGNYNSKSLVSYGDSGGASRFFYVAKASKRDRDEGLEGMPEREAHKLSGGEFIAEGRTAVKGKAMARNHHPTVKPTQLMRYLVRLVTPPGGLVGDFFMGSGSTGKAAMLEGFRFVGIEIDPGYFTIAQKRIEQAQMQLPLLEPA